MSIALEPMNTLEYARTLADDDCISWHSICGAECCKSFSFPDNNNYDLEQDEIQVHVTLDRDNRRYYELHGCRYGHGILYIKTKYCTKENGRIEVRRTCDYLTPELRCARHNTHDQPRVCKNFTLQNIRAKSGPIGATLTPNCLFRWKLLIKEQEAKT